MVNILYFIGLNGILFIVGFFGIISNKRSILLVLLSIELILLSININFILFSTVVDTMDGLIFSLFILAVAAAESVIGLAIIVNYYQTHRNLNASTMVLLQSLDKKRQLTQQVE